MPCSSRRRFGSGARRAAAGEFSQRAFLNDKLDLVQAEAIADLIGSGTEQAARAALRSLSGAFSERVETLSESLIKLRLHVEAAIDFPEEEIDFPVGRGAALAHRPLRGGIFRASLPLPPPAGC